MERCARPNFIGLPSINYNAQGAFDVRGPLSNTQQRAPARDLLSLLKRLRSWLRSLVPNPLYDFELDKTKEACESAEKMRVSLEQSDGLTFLIIHIAVLTLWAVYYINASANYVPLFANALICALNTFAACVYVLASRMGTCPWFEPHAVMAVVVVGHAALIALHENSVQQSCYEQFSLWRVLRDAPDSETSHASNDSIEWLTAHNFFINHSYFMTFVLPTKYAAATCFPCLFTYISIVQSAGGPTTGFYTSALGVYCAVIAKWQSTRGQRQLFRVIESQRRALLLQAGIGEVSAAELVRGAEEPDVVKDSGPLAAFGRDLSEYGGGLESNIKGLLPQSEHFEVIQFSSDIYYCAEDDGFIDVFVNRMAALGHELGHAAVHYETRDRSAVAGQKYVATAGVLRFGKGVRERSIRIQVLQDERFDTSLDFEVVLSQPSHASLGLYLHTARVVIVDDDAFPTNKFKEELDKQKYDVVPPWSLMMEFARNCLSDSHFRVQVLKTAICDQVSNLRWILKPLLSAYLLDEVLNPVPPKVVPNNVTSSVFIIVFLGFVPSVVEFLLQHYKARLGIRGMVLARLQANLLRRFLQYDEASRNQVSPSDIIMAITRDVPQLVDEGLLPMFKILKTIGLFLLLSALALNFLLKTTYVFSILLFIAVPATLVGFVRLRRKGSTTRRTELFEAQTHVVGFIQESIDCYRLIADYRQTSAVVESFGHLVRAANRAFTSSSLWEISNLNVAPFLTNVLAGAFILFTFQQVLARSTDMRQGNINTGRGLGIGEFCAGIAVCERLGGCLQKTYLNILRIQSAIAPLHNVVCYMNMPVDATLRMHARRRTCEWSRAQQNRIETNALDSRPLFPNDSRRLLGRLSKSGSGIDVDNPTSVLAVDNIPIQGTNVTFSYSQPSGQAFQVFNRACFIIQQGQLVAVTGDRRCGKSTFLHLLAGVQVPNGQSGDEISSGLFIPPHLRVLHVSAEPISFKSMDILDNLCFGLPDRIDKEFQRVLAICERISVSPQTMKQLESEVRKTQGHACSVVDELDHIGELYEDRAAKVACVGTSTSVAQRSYQALGANQAQLFSRTDQCLLHIARALVMNPEVLVIHKPLENFDELLKHKILKLLREFTDLRGLELPANEFSYRRPRTCFFSTSSTNYTENIDVALHITEGNVVVIKHSSLELLNRCISKMLHALDRNSDGHVSREEFLHAVLAEPWLAHLFGLKADFGDDANQMKAAAVFDLMDLENKGEIGLEELEKCIRGLVDANLTTTLDFLKTSVENSTMHEEQQACDSKLREHEQVPCELASLEAEQVPCESALPETIAWALRSS